MAWKVDSADIEVICDPLQRSKGLFRFVRRTESLAIGDNKPAISRRKSSGLSDNAEVQSDEQASTHYYTLATVAQVKGVMVVVKFIPNCGLNTNSNLIANMNMLLDLKHQNVAAFIGACAEPRKVCFLWEYCSKGSLQDVISNNAIKLDTMFKFALCQDVAKGLDYIHKSAICYHGNLKSSNCVIDTRWMCKLTDFGMAFGTNNQEIRKLSDACAGPLLWSAPEVLRCHADIDHQKADIYSLGVIIKEVFSQNEPYAECDDMSTEEIVNEVKLERRDPPFRPSLINITTDAAQEVRSLLEICWNSEPKLRPTTGRIIKALSRINPNRGVSMIDNMVSMLEKYANNLEDLVTERTRQLDEEKSKTEELLYRMIPRSVAENLKLGKAVEAEMFDKVTVFFSDIVGFTSLCAESTPLEVVEFLNSLYTMFDNIVSLYDIYKVETIGDAYMLVSGLPNRNGTLHTLHICDCALHLLDSVATFVIPHRPLQPLHIRIGIHTGPVVTGVVGTTMPRYCLFGDTVNTASRMESNGLPMKIHLSSATASILQLYREYRLTCRGPVDIKGKGSVTTYFLDGKETEYVTNTYRVATSRQSGASVRHSAFFHRFLSASFAKTPKSKILGDNRDNRRRLWDSVKEHAKSVRTESRLKSGILRRNTQDRNVKFPDYTADNEKSQVWNLLRSAGESRVAYRDSRSLSFGAMSQISRKKSKVRSADTSPSITFNDTPIFIPLHQKSVYREVNIVETKQTSHQPIMEYYDI